MFKFESEYTRSEIHAAIGGSMQACLLTKDSHVVGVCFVRKKNPEGPKIILVGHGPQKERAAEALAKQAEAVPVFAKKAVDRWEYLGSYKGEKYAPSPIPQYVESSGRTDVAGVLFLKDVL